MSDRKPQLKELSLALRDLTWSDIESMSLQLDMPYIKLQQIKQQSNEPSQCLHSAMHSWLENDPKASWARIVTALIDINKNVLAKEIEQKYCQPLDIPHATTEESAANHLPLHSNTPPPPSPPIAEDPLSPISLAASDYSLPSPSPHIYTSDSTEVSSPLIPHAPSSPSQQAPSQLSTDPPISPVSEYSHPTSPPSVSVATPDGGTPTSQSKQSPSQPPSSPTQQPRKRKRRNSPTILISPSSSPSPQPPPQPPQLCTTQPQELPGWQPTVVRESKQERIRRVKQEASKLQKEFVSVLTHTEICFSEKESEPFLRKLRITLKNLPLSNEFEHLKFLKDESEALKSASSVSDIFELLRQYWNYTDFALLHHLINEFGDDSTNKMMERYISNLEMFEKRTMIKDYEDATGVRKKVPQGFVEAAFEVQGTKDPSEYTLYEVRQIVESLAQQSSLEPYVPMLKKARIGSLVITIALPRPALELLQQALYKEFLDTLNIVSVTIHRSYKMTQVNVFCHKCLKVHVIVIYYLTCDTVVCITFVTIHKHSPHSELVVLQDRLSLVSASRTGEEATVTSLLDSGADPHFRDIVRKESRIWG